MGQAKPNGFFCGGHLGLIRRIAVNGKDLPWNLRKLVAGRRFAPLGAGCEDWGGGALRGSGQPFKGCRACLGAAGISRVGKGHLCLVHW